jgi:hypothetical protein
MGTGLCPQCAARLGRGVRECYETLLQIQGVGDFWPGLLDADADAGPAAAHCAALLQRSLAALPAGDADAAPLHHRPLPAEPAAAWPAAAARAFCAFGACCASALLAACAREPRPELWGRYCAALNRLQGWLRDAGLEAPGGCGGSAGAVAAAAGDWLGEPEAAAAAPGGGGGGASGGLPPAERRAALRRELLGALARVEAAVGERRGPAHTAAGDVAFPKGKEIVCSVIKRLRRRLLGEAPPPPRGGPGGGPGGPGGRAYLAAPLFISLALFGCAVLRLSPPAVTSLPAA